MGYQIHYDIFLLGLLLLKVALCSPLLDFLAQRVAQKKEPHIALPPDVHRFQEAEAFAS
jgi:hypothetical protein